MQHHDWSRFISPISWHFDGLTNSPTHLVQVGIQTSRSGAVHIIWCNPPVFDKDWFAEVSVILNQENMRFRFLRSKSNCCHQNWVTFGRHCGEPRALCLQPEALQYWNLDQMLDWHYWVSNLRSVLMTPWWMNYWQSSIWWHIRTGQHGKALDCPKWVLRYWMAILLFHEDVLMPYV